MKLLNSEIPLYSTFKIESKNYRPLVMAQLMDLPENSIIILDEAYTWIESRTSSKYTNIFASYLGYQLRKTNRYIFILCIDLSSIDIRLRNSWDYFIHALPRKDLKKSDFKYKFFNKMSHKKKTLRISFKQMSEIFNYYNTFEIIEAPNKERIKFELIKTDPKKFEYYARNIVLPKIINNIKQYSKITKNVIKYCLITNGYPQIWADIIFVIISANELKKK